MTASHADLIRRLRATDYLLTCPPIARPRNPDGPEAAEAIEALQADNERLRAALQKARPYVADLPIVGDADLAAIDAALTTKGEADD